MILSWSKVRIEGFGWDLPDERVSSEALETRLRPAYERLHLAEGQLRALTGIQERRQWPPGTAMSARATVAARHALEAAGVDPVDLGCIVYGGVCRDNLEPATACAVAEAVGAPPDALVFDLSNACLGVLSGVIEAANAIELGRARAALVVSCESSRTIADAAIAALNADPTLDRLRHSLATLTGGSAAVAVVLTHEDFSYRGHQLVGGAALSAPQHHRICRWGPEAGLLGETPNVMVTDATAVLTHGVTLGRRTFAAFQEAVGWHSEELDKVVCHQVGAPHRDAILAALDIAAHKDLSTFETLGNTGSVALPLTAALANEQGHLSQGDRVALLGIGSGLNCIMLGVTW